MTDTASDIVISSPHSPHTPHTPHSPHSSTTNGNNNNNNNNITPNTQIINNDEVNKIYDNHPLNSAMYGYQGLHFCHLNVRSLINKMHEIKRFLKNKNVQILTIS